MATDSGVLIDVKRLTKTFDTLEGPLPVLDDVSLQVRGGEREIVALLGKSGSGKSTFAALHRGPRRSVGWGCLVS